MLNITVNAVFLDEQSIPEDDIYLWAYHIQIVNKYDMPVIIKKRVFEVIDILGQRNVIEGAGVANKECSIASNELFEYVSGVLLNQPSGFFSGFFIVQNQPCK